MPVAAFPAKFKRFVREHIRVHEHRIEELRREIYAAQQEVAIHELILDLAQNDPLMTALGRLCENANDGLRFARDPLRYCREQGISLPNVVTLHAADEGGRTARKRGGSARRILSTSTELTACEVMAHKHY